MKRIFTILALTITTAFLVQTSTSFAQVEETEFYDTWELHYEQSTLRTGTDTDSYHVYRLGWYLFNFDLSSIHDDHPARFIKVDFESDMYIPELQSGFEPTLYYVEEYGQLASTLKTSYEYAINTAASKLDGIPVCFFSEVYPYDTQPPKFLTNSVDTYLSQRETINDIKSRIYAYDLNDKDVSHNIAIIKENYSHDKTDGIKEVDLQVNDNAGNISYHTVFINVIDDNISTISSKNIFTTTSSILSEQLIIDNINAYDYLGNEFDVTIISDDYFDNATKSGIYFVTVFGVDQFGDEVEHTLEITVYNSEYDFYTFDKKTLYFDEYVNFTDKQLLELLDIITYFEINYLIGVVDSRIIETSGEHYVFYELYDGTEITEMRLTISFDSANITTNIQEDTTINISEYITTFISSTILILLIIHIINHALEKRK